MRPINVRSRAEVFDLDNSFPDEADPVRHCGGDSGPIST
jgi:hypothetical protein